MSQVYKDYGTLYTISVGTTKMFTSVIIDPNTGQAMDMTNQTVFTSGSVDITQADGTLIQSAIPINFSVRTAGASRITWVAGPFTNLQAGNWKAFLKINNSLGIQIDGQTYNFQITELY